MNNRMRLLDMAFYDLLCYMNENLLDNGACVLDGFDAGCGVYRCSRYKAGECYKCIEDYLNEEEKRND